MMGRHPTLAVAGALTPSCKVKGLPHSQGCIVLVCLLHIPRTPLHKEVLEGLAIVYYLSVHLIPRCALSGKTSLHQGMQLCLG